MGICSYLAIPRAGQRDALARRLAALPDCEVLPSLNRDILVLVTDTADRSAERALRDRIESLDGIRALVLTFAEVAAP